MTLQNIEWPEEAVAEFCRRWGILELSLFGSVLRDDFGPESDVDILVTYASRTQPHLWGHIRAERELAEILGRPVDLVNREAVDEDRDELRRRTILSHTIQVYAAA